MVKRNVMKGNGKYVLMFDEYGYLDTVHKHDEKKDFFKQLNGGNAAVKFFVTHQHDIYQKFAVKGCVYI